MYFDGIKTIPNIYLFLQVLFDFYYCEKKFYLKRLPVFIFFVWYGLFINGGIILFTELIREKLSLTPALIFSTVSLFAGYNLTKRAALKKYKKYLQKEKTPSFLLFLKYFTFSSGSVIALALATAFLYLLKIH